MLLLSLAVAAVVAAFVAVVAVFAAFCMLCCDFYRSRHRRHHRLLPFASSLRPRRATPFFFL